MIIGGKLIASAVTNGSDREALIKAGFKLDERFPAYIQPIFGTWIESEPNPDGTRTYTQYRSE